MTVAIFDGKSLAADRKVTLGHRVVGYVKKIEEWKKGYYVIAGQETENSLIREFLNEGISFKPKKGFQCIFSKGKDVFHIGEDLVSYPVYSPWGIGSGGDDAEVLCRVGYTAEEAARTVCTWNTVCGGKIDVVKV